MDTNQVSVNLKNKSTTKWKDKVKNFIRKAKRLQGDPRFIAKGIAIGVFVGVTPTIPFHTAIAIALAFILKGSKPAAAIGVWSGNPITIPFFYMGSYKVGMLLIGSKAALNDSYWTIQELLHLGFSTTFAMILGGMILGILPAIAAYFISFNIFSAIKARKMMKDKTV